jgi:hypothetical protein
MMRLRFENAALADERAAALEAAQASDTAKSRFLAMVSHEIRTPLNGIFGMVQVLRGQRPDPRADHSLQVVENSARHLGRIIDDLLDLSRLDFSGVELQPAALNVREVVTGVVDILEPLASRRGLDVALRWRGDAAPPVWAELPSASAGTVGLRFVPAARGWQDVPPLVVETRFPFGFMRAWTVWQPATQLLVWPRPEPSPPALPLLLGRDVPASTPARRLDTDPGFNGLRPWRSGDSMRDVAWRFIDAADATQALRVDAGCARELPRPPMFVPPGAGAAP